MNNLGIYLLCLNMFLWTKVTFPTFLVFFFFPVKALFAVKKHPVTPRRADSRGAEEGQSSTVEKWHITPEDMKYVWSVQTQMSVFIYLQSGGPDSWADLSWRDHKDGLHGQSAQIGNFQVNQLSHIHSRTGFTGKALLGFSAQQLLFWKRINRANWCLVTSVTQLPSLQMVVRL